MTPTKIAFLLPDLRGGGAERVAVDLACYFANNELDSRILVLQKSGELVDEAERATGNAVHSLGKERMRTALFPLVAYLHNYKPDVVIASLWPLTVLAGLAGRLAFRSGTTVIAVEHNDFRHNPAITSVERKLLARFGKHLYRLPKAVVAVSRGAAESVEQCAGLKAGSVRVVYNPIRAANPTLVRSSELPSLAWFMRWRAKRTKLLAIGSLKRQKGFDLLLRAFAIVRSRLDASLLIVGEGAERRNLEDLARALRVAEHVEMPGFRNDISSIAADASLFVLSSRTEGFGNVLVEALSYGVPVVSTRCPSGPSEIISSEKLGVLCNVGDVESLAESIISALQARWDRQALRDRAAEFSVKAAAENYIRIIRDVA